MFVQKDSVSTVTHCILYFKIVSQRPFADWGQYFQTSGAVYCRARPVIEEAWK